MKKLLIVRHPDTNLNDPPERLRGWENVPVNAKGKQEAKKIAKNVIKEAGDSITHIFTSDLLRARYLATEIGRQSGVGVTPMKALRTWTLGVLDGQPMKQVGPIMKKLSETKNRDIKPEGGESFNHFLDRYERAMKGIMKMEGDTAVIVAHHQNLVAGRAWISPEGGRLQGVLDNYMEHTYEPGAIIVVERHGKQWDLMKDVPGEK